MASSRTIRPKSRRAIALAAGPCRRIGDSDRALRVYAMVFLLRLANVVVTTRSSASAIARTRVLLPDPGSPMTSTVTARSSAVSGGRAVTASSRSQPSRPARHARERHRPRPPACRRASARCGCVRHDSSPVVGRLRVVVRRRRPRSTRNTTTDVGRPDPTVGCPLELDQRADVDQSSLRPGADRPEARRFRSFPARGSGRRARWLLGMRGACARSGLTGSIACVQRRR